MSARATLAPAKKNNILATQALHRAFATQGEGGDTLSHQCERMDGESQSVADDQCVDRIAMHMHKGQRAIETVRLRRADTT